MWEFSEELQGVARSIRKLYAEWDGDHALQRTRIEAPHGVDAEQQPVLLERTFQQVLDEELGLSEILFDPEFEESFSLLALLASLSGELLIAEPLIDRIWPLFILERMLGADCTSAVRGRMVTHAGTGATAAVCGSVVANESADPSPLLKIADTDKGDFASATLSGEFRYLSKSAEPKGTVAVLTEARVSTATGIGSCKALTTLEVSDFCTSDSTVDGLHETYRVTIENADALVIPDYLSVMLREVECLLRAAELHGMLKVCEQQCVEYVQTRKQFGVPVGSFQTVKHALADVHVLSESLGALIAFARDGLEKGLRSPDCEIPSEVSLACRAALHRGHSVVQALESLVQLHGGVGFTWEYDLHLYLRRAKTLTALYPLDDEWVQGVLTAAA